MIAYSLLSILSLVPDRPRDPQMKSKEAAVGWLPVTGEDGSPTLIYEVDYILDQRGSGEDTQYLVKWRGAPEDRATWEPAANLTNCPALFRAWRRYLRLARKAQRGLQNIAPVSGDTASASASSPTFLSPGGEGVERHPPAAAPLIAEDSLHPALKECEPAEHISPRNSSDSEANSLDRRKFAVREAGDEGVASVDKQVSGEKKKLHLGRKGKEKEPGKTGQGNFKK
ncbi:uncharacterized protein EMH_0030760 [Eimeria mitis]|uniref:Chromo domain-containing protein n=1 Tax=Eimeria mitis TaxID=44415 RepID=U6JTH0_9EIME|nr:uncharacterized protein EMH_0030760 [Eimeria mitis]CDJ27322.1 hypothetical protein EMH_0030760 [Eimeria mitis]